MSDFIEFAAIDQSAVLIRRDAIIKVRLAPTWLVGTCQADRGAAHDCGCARLHLDLS
jgi:hypothetical protein